jgi:hypothetical protein
VAVSLAHATMVDAAKQPCNSPAAVEEGELG